MAFCTNCGKELPEGAKFCLECGTSVSTDSGERKTIYEGKIHKCPNCGEVLSAFVVTCPSCGYDLHRETASSSVREFAIRLADAQSASQKIILIQSFPIPSSKEDILEFMILAASCFDADDRLSGTGMKKELADAWFAKLEQGYQKARLLFSNDADFSKIRSVYEKTNQQIQLTVHSAQQKELRHLILRTIGLWGGFLVLLIAFFVDITTSTTDTSILHLGGAAIMIIGALMVGKKASKLIDVGIGVAAALLAILLGMLLQEQFSGNGSVMELGGGAALIITIIQLVRKNKK